MAARLAGSAGRRPRSTRTRNLRQLRPARVRLRARARGRGPPALRSTPQIGAQPGAVAPAQQRRSGAPARARRAPRPGGRGPRRRRTASRAPRPRRAGRPRARRRSNVGAAGSRQRMHGPDERRLEPQPQRVAVAGRPRDVEPGGDQRRLAAGTARRRARTGRSPRRGRGGGPRRALRRKPPEIEGVGADGHAFEISRGGGVAGPRRPARRPPAPATPRSLPARCPTGFAPTASPTSYDELLIGAYPLDADDVEMLAFNGRRPGAQPGRGRRVPPRRARRGAARAGAAAGIEEHRLRLHRLRRASPPRRLEPAVAAGQRLARRRRARTYVHCRAGWQRSAAVAAGVVALREGIDIDEALARVQSRKPSADPLPHQREDLRRWWA